MPAFQLVTQSEQDADNRSTNTQRMINCYVEPVGNEMVIKSVLGMDLFASVTGVFARAVAEIGDRIYLVQGGTLYGVSPDGTTLTLGSVTDSAETTISGNDGNVTIAAGGNYYVWNGSTLTQPAAGAFSDFGSVAYLGSLTVLTERNGNRVQWSDVFDPTTLNGLSFATADAFDDKILRAMTVGGSLFIFKETSIEQWYQNGADLAPVASGAIEYGLKAYGLLAKVPNRAFFVSSENKVMIMAAGGATPISNRAVETAISQSTPTNCFFYQDEGHDFCVVRFSDRPAWVYDIVTGRWHERAEGDTFDAWSAVGSVKLLGNWYVATEIAGIYRLTRSNEDASAPLIRQVTTPTLRNEGGRFKIGRFEVDGRVGFSSLGRDASLMLEMSRDGGNTWTAPKVRSMGGQGNYDQRMVWRALGQYREATARLSWTDPDELSLNSTAFLDVA